MIRKLLEKLYKRLERYLYDDLNYQELEDKYYRAKRIIEDLQDKYNDNTYYSL